MHLKSLPGKVTTEEPCHYLTFTFKLQTCCSVRKRHRVAYKCHEVVLKKKQFLSFQVNTRRPRILRSETYEQNINVVQ